MPAACRVRTIFVRWSRPRPAGSPTRKTPWPGASGARSRRSSDSRSSPGSTASTTASSASPASRPTSGSVSAASRCASPNRARGLPFPEYFAARTFFGAGQRPVFCTGPIHYIGAAAVRADIETFRAALEGVRVEEAFLPAVAPGTIEHWLRNEYYPSDEAYLYAIADAVREEYEAIVEAGFVLQIDDPDLADAWQIHPKMSVPEYRRFAELRLDALNHALRTIPPDRVRFHMCWGSYHGPHRYDIPLRDIVDLVLKVRAGAYSIEASNPCHQHEWRVWEDVKLPPGKILVPGVVGHYSDFIEHPELVAERLVTYARLVGRENVIAGTDCGLGTRVGHPSITWAKFQAMAEGARLATKQLWGS